MLRPERMSQAKILFLKSDSEIVMDSLNKHGAFHLHLKEAEGPTGSELSESIQELLGRLREVTTKIDSLSGNMEPTKREALPPVQAFDWPSFIGSVDRELQDYEREVQSLDAGIQKDARTRPLFDLWKSYATSEVGATSLEYLQYFHRINPIILYPKVETPGDLAAAIPSPSLVYAITSKPTIYLVLCLKEDRKKLLQSATEKGYSSLEALEGMPPGYSALGNNLQSFEASMNRSNETLTMEEKSALGLKPRLAYLNSLLADAYSVLSIKEKSSVEERWAVIEGYVPTKQGGTLIKDLNARLEGRMIYSLNEEHSSNQVPVTFKYPKFINLFYTVTNLYGVPNYNEINPTPILALTFPIFFGLMFPDIGHGIMLACLGFIFYKFTKSLSKIGIYLIICGIFASLMGAILYGDAFGIHIYAGLITPQGVIQNIMTLFIFALAIGIFQITLGMVIGIANNFLQKKRVDAFLVNMPKLALYLLSIYVVAVYGLNFSTWPIYLILAPLFLFLLAKPVFEMAKDGLGKGLSALGEMGFETFDTIIRFVSNTVSYLRIFAMVIAHAMLTYVFYALGSLVGGGVLGILLAVVGNIFVMLIEGVIVLAQDLRLHFYEFFSRFYEDGGVMFTPFKLSNEIPIKR
jgi:V/A-type H+-transporting ATPase subunit I